jgi:hypothetical protein
MFAIGRPISRPGMFRPPKARLLGGRGRRRHPWAKALERVGAVLLVLSGVSVAAVLGWLLAGGNLALPEVLVDRVAPGTAATPAGTAPIHLDSSPSHAQVNLDGTRLGWTPLDVQLSPGQHAVGLQHPDALDQDERLTVPESGAAVSFRLWRRRPDVLPLRPVYPGASLVDAHFLDDGRVALLISLPPRPGESGATRELWRLDPATGQPSRVTIPGIQSCQHGAGARWSAGRLRDASLVVRRDRQPVAGKRPCAERAAAGERSGGGLGGPRRRHRSANPCLRAAVRKRAWCGRRTARGWWRSRSRPARQLAPAWLS